MRVTTLDAHVAGGAVRLVTSGVPTLDGQTMSEKRSSFEQIAGHIAEALCREPRGHAGVVGVVLTEAERDEADCGMLFFTGDGSRALSGHAAMGAAALALDAAILTPREPGVVAIDTEAGVVRIEYDARAPRWPRRLRCTGPPASVVRGAAGVTTGRRPIRLDIAWSGSELVAVVDGESAGVPMSARHTLELRRAALELLEAIEGTIRVPQPESDARAEVGACAFVGPSSDDRADVRAVMIRADGSISRTPSASASAAIAVVLAAMGVARQGSQTRIESLAGLAWSAELGTPSAEGRWPVTIVGEAHPTGSHEFRLEPSDPLLRGAGWQ